MKVLARFRHGLSRQLKKLSSLCSTAKSFSVSKSVKLCNRLVQVGVTYLSELSIQRLQSSSEGSSLVPALTIHTENAENTFSPKEEVMQSPLYGDINKDSSTLSQTPNLSREKVSSWAYRYVCYLVHFLLPKDIGVPWREEVKEQIAQMNEEGCSSWEVNVMVLLETLCVVLNTTKEIWLAIFLAK